MNRQVGNAPPTCGKYQISRVPVKDLPVTQSKYSLGVGWVGVRRREGRATKQKVKPSLHHLMLPRLSLAWEGEKR